MVELFKKICPRVFLSCVVDDIEPWLLWAYYASPMMYGQNAIFMNEFLDKRWSMVRSFSGLIVFN